MSQTQPRIKRGQASLIGGIAVGAASFILCAAAAHELALSAAVWLPAGVLIAVCVAAWIRLADL